MDIKHLVSESHRRTKMRKVVSEVHRNRWWWSVEGFLKLHNGKYFKTSHTHPVALVRSFLGLNDAQFTYIFLDHTFGARKDAINFECREYSLEIESFDSLLILEMITIHNHLGI